MNSPSIFHRLRSSLALAAALTLAALAFPGQSLAEKAQPWPHSEDLQRELQPFIDRHEIAGAVTWVGDAHKTLHLGALGFSDLNSATPMRPDSLFWIASMTKPLAAVCILQLADERKLTLDDRVDKHLPEFRDLWMVADRSDQKLSLVRPPRAISIRDLLTHTSGIGNVPEPRFDCSLAELVMAYSQQPLRFPPGSRWEYSNAGINTLGRIVEVVSGLPFERFLQKRVIQPLGLKDTTFWPNAAQARRLATSYRATTNSTLEPTSIFFLQNAAVTDRRRTPKPAGGLFSTASDLSRIYQMLLQKGVWKGKRLLSEWAVEELTRTQSGDIKTGFVNGMSWGLGFQVVKEPQGVTSMLSKGTYGHGGAYGTQSWADPKRNRIYILLIQRAGFPNADASDVRKTFQEIGSRP